jgi:predicted metalloprotease with PDZ domain
MKTRALLLVALFQAALPLSGKEELPPVILEGLTSDVFSVREKAQVSLLEWAREIPQSRTATLLKLSNDEDPEIRKRAAEILRQLSDEDYLSDGQGYLGIMMAEEMLNAGPDGKPGAGIRISMVMKDSPADSSGLKVGDLVVALDGKTWDEPGGALDAFMQTVAGKKPLMDVVLTVRRAAPEPIEIRVKLGKRPVADLQSATGNIQMLDKQAKDQHFREWLKRHKSAHD